MGIDFRIDDASRYRLTGAVGHPEHPDAPSWQPWRGRRFDGELVDSGELAYAIESHVYDGPITLTIETVPQQPPLPSETPEGPNWPYSGFMRFRERVARTIDVDLHMMEGFYDELSCRERYFNEPLGSLSGVAYEYQQKEAKRRWENEARTWDEIDSDLVPLLHHSDCDGDLSPAECARVAPALREALSAMSLDFQLDQHVEKGHQLAHLMDFCAKYGRRLRFC